MDYVFKEWLTPDDLELEFKIKEGTQANLRSSKKIPFSKVGNFIYYSRTKIYEWLENHHHEPIS